MKTHPVQPLVLDVRGTLCFKENKIVNYLLDNGPFNMNDLAVLDFSQEDREQFAQLIGYSLEGFGELSYVTDYTYSIAESMSRDTSETGAKIQYLEATLRETRLLVKQLAPVLFHICPEELVE